MPFMLRLYLAVSLMLGVLAHSASAEDRSAAWKALRTGSAFAIMRHALAPGFGDPPDFRIGDCSTQRNLSEEGRQQAREVGDAFRAHGISQARVLSSQWCRCLETAQELRLGPVEELPALNSLHGRRDAALRTEALKTWLHSVPTGQLIILVTHQANISALTGGGTASGEVIVARLNSDGTFETLGRLPPG